MSQSAPKETIMVKSFLMFGALAVGTCALLVVSETNVALADQVVGDDQIVQGSLCVGFDCVNNESFGFDTIRLKENNTRILFEDTSNSAGFPANDWQLTANDSTSGGASYFSIDDVTGGNRIFQVDAGAPALSLHIDSSGNLNLAAVTARITNLADPVDSTDAVNLQTLNAAVAAVSYSDPVWMSSSSSETAYTSGNGSTAIGGGASAKTNDTAVGYRATVTADGSTAVGANSLIQSTNSVAIGADSTVESGAAGGTAVGQNARVAAGAVNSVALGKDSVATEPNTVSVGSSGNERRITNVAAGINSTDAVNMGQLGEVSSRVSVNSANIAKNKRNIAANSEDILENRTDIDRNSLDIEHLEDDMKDSFAGIAAVASLITLSPSAPGKTTFNLGAANFKGESGVGVSVAHRLNSAVLGDDLYLNCGFAVSNGETVRRIGGSWEF